MSDKFTTYVRSSLALTGLSILEPSHGFAARSDLWSGATFASCDWPKPAEMDQAIAQIGARRFVAEHQDPDGRPKTLRIAAMSDKALADRLEHALGFEVSVRPVLRFADPLPAPVAKPAPPEDAPPPYICEARDEWFAAHPGLVDPLKDLKRKMWFGVVA